MAELTYDQFNNSNDLTEMASQINAAIEKLSKRIDELDGGAGALIDPMSQGVAINLADSFGRTLESYLNNPNKKMLWTDSSSLLLRTRGWLLTLLLARTGYFSTTGRHRKRPLHILERKMRGQKATLRYRVLPITQATPSRMLISRTLMLLLGLVWNWGGML